MGVTGLWSVVQPAARPIKIETLNKKRLAVDASIWIYQFLKAVRDKEGNALRNSHVVGFFRRICKLLFIGIKPVFVFDGGAPALKRQTISGRKARREGRREDAVRTAGKLLALQMQRRAEEDEERRRAAKSAPAAPEEEELPENLVYVDELAMTQQERQQSRKFKKKDQYHLPDLDAPLSEMGQPNDPRVMSIEELEAYAKQFNTEEDINVYDFSKIDFESPFFTSLPASDRYNILNAARLRSRLRMGLSKDQLDTMFPDRMAFSRFQIERVRERNELTQRLMSINNNDEPWSLDGGGRVAGEKGREYVLVKNDGVEGGWALGVISDNTEGVRSKPIDVDELAKKIKAEEEDDDWEDEEAGFEDVPIEGLNRLPKLPKQPKESVAERAAREILGKRTAVYQQRRKQAQTHRAPHAPPARLVTEDSDSLFVGGDDTGAANDEVQHDTDDEELRRAIAMSLEKDDEVTSQNGTESSPDDDEFEEVFGQHTTQKPQSTTSGIASRTSKPFVEEDSDDEDFKMDMNRALAESRSSMYKSRTSPAPPAIQPPKPASRPAFSGPLPFENAKLDLGSSLLGKKKMKEREEEAAGGFERNVSATGQQKKSNEPLPPWFSEDLKKGMDEQQAVEAQDRLKEREEEEQAQFEFVSKPTRLRQQDTNEVIDVDALDDRPQEVIDIDGSGDEMVDIVEDEPAAQVAAPPLDDKLRMGDVADMVRAEPPEPAEHASRQHREPSTEPISKSSIGKVNKEATTTQTPKQSAFIEEESDEEPIEWEESDHEQAIKAAAARIQPAGGPLRTTRSLSESPEMEFENVDIPAPAEPEPAANTRSPSTPLEILEAEDDSIIPATGVAHSTIHEEEDDEGDRDYYSDLSDEELLASLATEAEEHARFASQLATASASRPHQSTEEFERELKALRSQQRSDRRDADEVTQQMITECQSLLSHFGLPYITAPMEAEAQCAELVRLRLVDGIVTDDSDIFLFGGTRVYKNMFNQAKFVECYLAADLEREFDLSREKMIAIAHLLGSDYTEGLPGVGPVTALEILSEFPNGPGGGLAEFKQWWERVQMGAPASDDDLASSFRKKFRKKSAKLFLPAVFPDLRVDQAYLHPEVDSDPSAFVWGVPDLDSLRSFLMATIGWSQERTDEVLVPVIRDMNRREKEGTQSNITQFLGGNVTVGIGAAGLGSMGSSNAGGGGADQAFAPRRKDVGKSRRMEVALERLAEKARERRRKGSTGDNRIGNKAASDDGDDALEDEDAVAAVPGSAARGVSMRDAHAVKSAARDVAGAQKSKKTTKTSKKRKAARAEEDNDVGEAGDAEDDSEFEKAPRRTKAKVRKTEKKTAAPRSKRRSHKAAFEALAESDE